MPSLPIRGMLQAVCIICIIQPAAENLVNNHPSEFWPFKQASVVGWYVIHLALLYILPNLCRLLYISCMMACSCL